MQKEKRLAPAKYAAAAVALSMAVVPFRPGICGHL